MLTARTQVHQAKRGKKKQTQPAQAVLGRITAAFREQTIETALGESTREAEGGTSWSQEKASRKKQDLGTNPKLARPKP